MSDEQSGKTESIVSIVFAIVLIIGSVGWLLSHFDDLWEILFAEDDPIPVEVVLPPEGMIDAVLYAECQEQLESVLIGEGPIPTDGERESSAAYLGVARETQNRLMELVANGNWMFNELDGKNEVSEEFKEGWKDRAREFHTELYAATARLSDLGPRGPYVLAHSEIFLAYRYLDLFSDEINAFFIPELDMGSISTYGLNRAKAHLETARGLLDR